MGKKLGIGNTWTWTLEIDLLGQPPTLKSSSMTKSESIEFNKTGAAQLWSEQRSESLKIEIINYLKKKKNTELLCW